MIDDSSTRELPAQKVSIEVSIDDVVHDDSDDENYSRRLVRRRRHEITCQPDEKQNQQRDVQRFLHVNHPVAMITKKSL